MITIYTSFRSFEDEQQAIIQDNSLKSWLSLQPSPQIIVFGDAPGVRDFCSGYNLVHIPNIRSSGNMIYMDSMLRIVEEISFFDTLLLLSPNVILNRNKLMGAIITLSKKMSNFLAICKKSVLGDVKLFDLKEFGKAKSTNEWSDGFYMFNRGFFDYYPPFLFLGGYYDKWHYWYGGRYRKSLVWLKDISAIHQSNFQIQEFQGNAKLARVNAKPQPNYSYEWGIVDPPPTTPPTPQLLL